MQHQSSTVETILAEMAARSHGVVTRVQLLRAGITREEIRQRMGNGSLHREHPGVYRVGHRARSVEATFLAAVWACGDGAVLSGRAAAYLWGLIKGSAPRPEVTALGARRIEGVTTHRARSIERTTHRGVPITTVPRTLVDLASHLSLDALARACHEAGVKHDTTPAQVEAVLAKRPKTKGAATLREILRGDVHVTLSELERQFLRRLTEADLPLPQTNKPAHGRRVDCRWPARRLTVELDSYRYHHARHAWEQDRRRERGTRPRRRVPPLHLRRRAREPGLMLAELRALLR